MINVCREWENSEGNHIVISDWKYELEELQVNNMLYRLSYCRSGQIALGFGAYIGICLDVVYLDGTI